MGVVVAGLVGVRCYLLEDDSAQEVVVVSGETKLLGIPEFDQL